MERISRPAGCISATPVVRYAIGTESSADIRAGLGLDPLVKKGICIEWSGIESDSGEMS